MSYILIISFDESAVNTVIYVPPSPRTGIIGTDIRTMDVASTDETCGVPAHDRTGAVHADDRTASVR